MALSPVPDKQTEFSKCFAENVGPGKICWVHAKLKEERNTT